MKISTILQLSVLFSSLFLVSCASGPTYGEYKASAAPPAPGKGRVIVYRAGTLGGVFQPAVKLNDQVIGKAKSNGFIATDQPAGTHEVSVSTEWTHKNTVTVQSGQTSFVALTTTPGVLVAHFIPNQVEGATAERDLARCKLAE